MSEEAEVAPEAGPGAGVEPFFGIFEGGGAKGIAHVGALKAVYDAGLRPVGVAGTSAGAIIAALVAVGYTPDELFSPDDNEDILSRNGMKPIHLLGSMPWYRFCWLRDLSGLMIALAVAGAAGAHHWLAGSVILTLYSLWVVGRTPRRSGPLWIGCAIGIGAFAIALAWGLLAPSADEGTRRTIGWIVPLAAIGLVLGLAFPIIRNRGLFDTSPLIDFLDRRLAEKLREHYQRIGLDVSELDRPIRFRHLDVENCIPLKVIVADAGAGNLSLFDDNRPEVPVAEAVAASAAIPLFFRSPKIGQTEEEPGAIYVDGGLISNLPAWSLRLDKRIGERRWGAKIPIYAFSLAQKKEHEWEDGLWNYIQRVLLTGIFGGQDIVQNFISDLTVIESRTSLRTLDFRCTRAAAKAAYDEARGQASRLLAKSRNIRGLEAQALQQFHASVVAEVQKRRAIPDADERLRVCVVDPPGERERGSAEPRQAACAVVASHGMGDDADDALELDWENPGAPVAYITGLAHHLSVQPLSRTDLKMTKYERALVRGDLASIISIPILPVGNEAAPPERILCIDSNRCLLGLSEDPTFMNQLQMASALLSKTLIERIAETNS